VTLEELRIEYNKIFLPSRNYAAKTRQHYGSDIHSFVTFQASLGHTEPSHLSLASLHHFLAELDRRGLTGVTRRRKTFALKSFFNFLELHGYIDKNIAEKLVLPEREEHTPRVLTENEYKRLQLAVANEPRDAAIIELVLQTGIRLSELSKVTINDLELPNKIIPDPDHTGQLHIRQGKGRKDRTLSLNYKVCRALKYYLQVRPNASTPALFVSKFRTGISPRGYEWILGRYLKQANIEGASVHTLRHTFGTHMAKNGANLKTIQEMMGHADLKTTSIYVSLARNMMNKDVQEFAL
jgi:site-specific recombinase XerD